MTTTATDLTRGTVVDAHDPGDVDTPERTVRRIVRRASGGTAWLVPVGQLDDPNATVERWDPDYLSVPLLGRFAKVLDAGQVHLTFHWRPTVPACDSGERTTITLAAIDDDAELADLVAAVVTARIPARRMCAHCFGARTRRMVRNAYLELADRGDLADAARA